MKALRGIDFTMYTLSTNHKLLGAVMEKWLSKKPCKFVKKYFSVSNFFMHIFNMSVTYLQNAEKIQWKL